MKIKDGFILRKVAGQNIVMPMGQKSLDFNSAITLNESGAFLWALLSDGVENTDELLSRMLGEYDVTAEIAGRDIEGFITKLRENNLLDE